MKERTDKQQRFQQVLKYFALCVIALAMSLFTGEKTVFAKLNVTGDKSLLKESKCTQTFDGTMERSHLRLRGFPGAELLRD